VTAWIGVFAGSFSFGAGFAAAMALPGIMGSAALIIGAAGLIVALGSLGAIVDLYATTAATGSAVIILLASIATGYSLVAAALPYVARRPRLPRIARHAMGTGRALVLLACTDPERYSPATVARLHNELTINAGVDVPLQATPFMFLSMKARYRAVGGRAPGPTIARLLAGRIREHLGESPAADIAWSHDSASLAHAIARRAAAGADRAIVVVLGTRDSEAVAHATEALAQTGHREAGIRVEFGRSLWEDTALAERLAERILSALGDTDRSSAGVVLACAGAPPAWLERHPAGAEEENYFNQRVRMLLADAGLKEGAVRVAWIDWQVPEVSDALRHLAALGSSTIVVAPSTVALPTLETSIDLRHAVTMARLPSSARVLVLPAWGDDESLVHAVLRSAQLEPRAGIEQA